MSTSEYLYISESEKPTNIAVVVLPEIFGLNQNIKDTVDKFSKELNILAVGMDFYYPIDQRVYDLDYTQDIQKAINLKSKTTAEDFLQIFTQTLDYIQTRYPNIKEFVVCGFCFGGRLAFLSGLDKRVGTIFSFYGAGSNVEYYNGKSVIEALSEARHNDSSFIIKGFFGVLDQSIPKSDRDLTKSALLESGVDYEEFDNQAEHAFFRIGSKNYDQKSYEFSWNVIKQTLNK